MEKKEIFFFGFNQKIRKKSAVRKKQYVMVEKQER